MNMIEVQLAGLFVDASSGVPIVVLSDSNSKVSLPIWIGMAEARAISLAVNNITTVRPLTHELYLSTIRKLGYVVRAVLINGVIADAYKATLVLEKDEANGEKIEMDARPSDAIALATATGAKVYVSSEILEKMGIKQSDIQVTAKSEDMRQQLEQMLQLTNANGEPSDEDFKDFLRDLKASDFKLSGDAPGGSES